MHNPLDHICSLSPTCTCTCVYCSTCFLSVPNPSSNPFHPMSFLQVPEDVNSWDYTSHMSLFHRLDGVWFSATLLPFFVSEF